MRTVVAVLRGGPSLEYEHSLKSGAEVLAALDPDKYEPRDIFIDRAGVWHLHGVRVAPERALYGTDVAWNALHGGFGEDGQVQRLLEQLGVAYTGPTPLAAGIAIDKHLARQEAKKLGIKIAHGVVVENTGEVDALAQSLFRSVPQPAVVKPLMGGSSIGMSVAENFAAFEQALQRAFAVAPQVLVEECIAGRPVSVGVIDTFRNERTYALIPVPSDFTHAQKLQLTTAAKKMHEALGLRHYSTHDFIVGRRGVYFLEVDALPILHKDSVLQQGLKAVGAKLSDFIEHVLQLARK